MSSPQSHSSESDPEEGSWVESAVFSAVIGIVWYHYDIPLGEVVFCIAYSLYLWFLNWIRFDCNRLAIAQQVPHTTLGRSQFLTTSGFQVYMGIAVIGTVFLPLLLLLAPLAQPWTTSVAQVAAPHLFVLLVQIVMEQLTNRKWVHDLPRILVPLGFSIWREWTLWTWVQESWDLCTHSSATGQSPPSDEIVLGLTSGLVLAVFNWLLYSYNLFFFLIMRMTPVYLDPAQSPHPEMRWIGYMWPVVVRNKEANQTKKEKPAAKTD
ncbi:hypothetical protein ACA910_013778 [Epithemia clementina (nom. ined.)]